MFSGTELKRWNLVIVIGETNFSAWKGRVGICFCNIFPIHQEGRNINYGALNISKDTNLLISFTYFFNLPNFQ